MIQAEIYRLELTQPLPTKIKIGCNDYSSIKICKVLETIIGERIVSKTRQDLIKKWNNITLEFLIIHPQKQGESLQILGKRKVFELYHV